MVNDEHNSDDEVSETNHNQLLESISKLDKVQHVKKFTRTEPTSEKDEFHLVKPKMSDKKPHNVRVHELALALKKKSNKFQGINKKLTKISRKSKVLLKPLEKPKAERIHRKIGYQNVQKELNNWEPIVTNNRVADKLVFPLKNPEQLKFNPKKVFQNRYRFKSKLQEKLEAIRPTVVKLSDSESESEFPLNLEEMVERRQELAKFRARQSYEEAKARRLRKIKSKKFHRIQKREKIKNQIKEFEMLQKTNPDEALKKLEEIERARAEERMTLRHKSTGQWAKSKLVRAKYDKDTRQVLANQLAVSRELTQKIHTNDSSDSENEIPETEVINEDNEKNPWINQDKEYADFISNYKAYWEEKNDKAKCNENNFDFKKSFDHNEMVKVNDLEQIKEFNNLLKSNKELKTIDLNEKKVKINKNDCLKKGNLKTKKIEQTKIEVKLKKEKKKIDLKKEHKKEMFKNKIDGKNIEKKLKNKIEKKFKQKTKINKIEKKKIETKNNDHSFSGWEVTLASDDEKAIDELFDTLEVKRRNKLKKLKVDSKKKTVVVNKKLKKKKTKKSNYNDLEQITQISGKPIKMKRPYLDEALLESKSNNVGEIKKKLNNVMNVVETENIEEIDPENFVKVKPTDLNNELPDEIVTEDVLDDEDFEINEDQQNLIAEAFEDDDVVNEFLKDKNDEIDKSKPKDIDLSMPGWGDWGGCGIDPNIKPKRRLVVKFPEKIKRKDDKKENVIIKESKDVKKIRKHQVSEVPFPFKSVKEYETSIKAPIGNTFIPEIAFRKLIEPKIVTKTGVVIEPMDESQLLLTNKTKLKKKSIKN